MVVFRIDAPSARDVKLASDIFGWDRPKNMERVGESWQIAVDLPPDARIEYQFVVDGRWTLDPENPNASENGFGGRNSCYIGPGYHFDSPDDVPELPMRRLTMRVSGEAATRVVTLYLPETGESDLPLLMYGDGPDYEAHVRPHFILQNLFEQGKLPPVAIALIPSKDRIQEYWKNSAPYERYVVESVLPAIRRRAPQISQDPSKVFVGGASLGGLISMRIAQRFPDHVAGGVHSQSGAFWASPGVFARSALARLNPELRLFIDWGRYEGVLTVSNDRMVDMLGRMMKPYGSAVTGEGHNWTAWRARFAAGVEYLLAP